MRLFEESEKSTFAYWFAHWCAYQKTAWQLGLWRPHHLLHDIEKPWLMLLWKDYPRVRAWHRAHASHHLEEKPEKEYRWEDMIIDWECGRLTKKSEPKNAQETMYAEMKKFPGLAARIYSNCKEILEDVGLFDDDLNEEFMSRYKVRCINCRHFTMWDGDPCCTEPQIGWNLVLPDLDKRCSGFEAPMTKIGKERCQCEKEFWEKSKDEFFKTYRISDPTYTEYINQHPEMLDIVEKEGKGDNHE